MGNLRRGGIPQPKRINQRDLVNFLTRNINHRISFRIGIGWHAGVVLSVDKSVRKFQYQPEGLEKPTWMEYKHIVQYDSASVRK